MPKLDFDRVTSSLKTAVLQNERRMMASVVLCPAKKVIFCDRLVGGITLLLLDGNRVEVFLYRNGG